MNQTLILQLASINVDDHIVKTKACSYWLCCTKKVWSEEKQQMVPISHKQACRDLGIQPIQLRKWKKDVDKIQALRKGQRKGKLTQPCKIPELEDRLQTLILEKRRIGRKVGENWIRRNARVEFEKLWPHKVTMEGEKKIFSDMSFSDGWLAGFLKRKNLSLRQPTKKAQVVPEDLRTKLSPSYNLLAVQWLSSTLSYQRSLIWIRH